MNECVCTIEAGNEQCATARIRNFDYASALSAISHLGEFSDTDDEFRLTVAILRVREIQKNILV